MSLGSNLGDRKATLHRAIHLLSERVGELCGCSAIIETEPWGYQSSNMYLNAAVHLRTPLPASEVLTATQAIERELGRTCKTEADGTYADRTIDIDLLLYGHAVIFTPTLRVPHPRMWQRDFVMQPLSELLEQQEPSCMHGWPSRDKSQRSELLHGGPDEVPLTQRRCATVGFFDGVHLGHQHLLSSLCKCAAQQHQQPLAVTFDRHPHTVVQAEQPTPLLSPPPLRQKLLHAAGVEVAEMQFDHHMAQLTARDFMRYILHDQLNVGTLLVGYDHRFGRPQPDHPETIDDYRAYGRECGIEVIVATELPAEQHVSSSAIRRALSAGDIAAATVMLGRPYEWSGRVVHGHAVGRTLGFPTANLSAICPHQLLPASGAYAVTVDSHPAMLNIGTRPTLAPPDHALSVEVHLLDYHGDLYGRELTVQFHARLRSEKRFADQAALRHQLEADRAAVLKLLQP